MQDSQINQICNFIWNTADIVLRDIFVRGKYRDVILPMTVIRRLDAVLEPTKEAVLEEKKWLDENGITDQEGPLKVAAGQQFYNSSPFKLKDLRTAAAQQRLRENFVAYLDGFSPNVQDILDKFDFGNQITRLSSSNGLDLLIERYLTPSINFGPDPVKNEDGTVRLPGLDNHAMGTIFEDLVRRFNEDNNEEAGEHWTPRDAVELMAKLLFLPIQDHIDSATYLLYDGALGTGGMLTIAEATLQDLGHQRGHAVSSHLYGQEINDETFAICKADLLLKGEEGAEDELYGGPEFSTLSNDQFKGRTFDFMISNPPYGKSWKTDQDRMGGKKLNDPRFLIQHGNDPEYSLATRSNDGQMLFLANMAGKMNHESPLGSRIAEVHNGSSLFTGDAGQGESNIRRWIIENDWLEAIVALPLNMFYNTGIATYIWVLSNRKPEHRKGKIQLINATEWFRPLRKNLGQKTRELSDEDVCRICDTFLAFEETEESKIFPNEAFGYWKVTVERPLRLENIDPERAYKAVEIRKLKEDKQRSPDAPRLIRRIHDQGANSVPLRGTFDVTIKGQKAVVEYEPDPELRDTEQIPLLHDGGIDSFLQEKVLPSAPDAWYDPKAVRIGYEINFNRHFHKPTQLRCAEDIKRDILALEEKQQASMKQAVRHCPSPHMRLKPSGIQWLGEIPEDWAVDRLKSNVSNVNDSTRKRRDSEPYIALEHVESWTGKVHDADGEVSFDSQVKRFQPGDVLFGKLRPYLAKVTSPNADGVCVGEFLVLRTDQSRLTASYLERLMRSKPVIDTIDAATFGAKMPRADWDFIGNLQQPVPPIADQIAIGEYLDELTSEIDAAIERARCQIELLEEYRTSLIADVITGKLDVRSI